MCKHPKTTRHADPDLEEMLTFLATQTCGEELDDFAAHEAIYWFANHYHSGQWSNLYSALSTSPYSPGPLARGPEDSFLYDALVAKYATPVRQTYADAFAQLPPGAEWRSCFGNPGSPVYFEYWRAPDGSRWTIDNGGHYLDFEPFNWTCKRVEERTP